MSTTMADGTAFDLGDMIRPVKGDFGLTNEEYQIVYEESASMVCAVDGKVEVTDLIAFARRTAMMVVNRRHV